MRILSLVTSPGSTFYRQQVKGLRRRGHTIHTVSVPGTRVEDGVDSGSRPPTAYARHFLRALRASAGEYDVVHCNYGLTAPSGVVQPFHPLVITLWGSDVMGQFGWLSDVCSRFADAVVVMSEEMADRLGTDCHVIPHGIDLQRFRPRSQADARAELGWEDGVHHVLFPYGPSRSVKDFPRAERIVDSTRRRLDEDVELQTMTGVLHERVPVYMNAADAMLLTSKREGSPNTVKEAMACNLPVVATDVGDVADLLDGVAHSTVASGDETLAGALAETLRSGERSDGRAAVSHLALETQLDRIEAVYRSVSGVEAEEVEVA